MLKQLLPDELLTKRQFRILTKWEQSHLSFQDISNPRAPSQVSLYFKFVAGLMTPFQTLLVN